MISDYFFDVKELTQRTGNNFSVNENVEKVISSEIKCLKVTRDLTHTVMYKTSYGDEEFKKFNVRRRMRSRRSEERVLLKPA